MLGTLQKRPADELDYDVNFEKWLTPNDTITSVTAIVAPVGELVVESTSITGQIVKVWLAGGVLNKTYSVTVTVATSGGRIKQVEFNLRVKDC